MERITLSKADLIDGLQRDCEPITPSDGTFQGRGVRAESEKGFLGHEHCTINVIATKTNQLHTVLERSEHVDIDRRAMFERMEV